MIEVTKEAFEWPREVKKSISKYKSSHFLGFTAMGGEKTGDIIDQREVRASQHCNPRRDC
jgi:isopenicillin N synthase-like dioxygenase